MPATIVNDQTGEITVYDKSAQVAHNWWAVLLRGVAYVLFGLAAFFAPGVALFALILSFGAFAVLSGVLTLVIGYRTRNVTSRWWLIVAQGLVGIAAGVAAFAFPTVTALALLYIVAFWAVLIGGFEIAAAVRLRKEIKGEWMLGLSGAIAVLLGLAMFFAPGTGLLAWMWVLAAYAVFTGILLVGLSFRLRSLDREVSAHEVGMAA